SYLPTLLGKSDQQKKHEYLYWTSREGTTSVGIRYQNWKLVKYRGKKGSKAEDWRLYDLSKDLGEEKDLAKEKPELVAKIKGLVEKDKLPLSAQRK
ncbi:MAG: N-acetylgalactosamine-6-sulfatase, partial [Akkermansiaceae bacterium]